MDKQLHMTRDKISESKVRQNSAPKPARTVSDVLEAIKDATGNRTIVCGSLSAELRRMLHREARDLGFKTLSEAVDFEHEMTFTKGNQLSSRALPESKWEMPSLCDSVLLSCIGDQAQENGAHVNDIATGIADAVLSAGAEAAELLETPSQFPSSFQPI